MAKGGQLKDKNGNKVFAAPWMPVGSIYISVINQNPSNYFGGTWEQFANGRTLVGVDTSQTEFNSVEKTGGEKEHTLTINEMPEHDHNLIHSILTAADNQTPITSYSGSTTTAHYYVASPNGGDQPHNNLQPYITVYMWKRIS